MRIEANVASVCKRLGRDPHEVTLLGATKYSEISEIKQAIDAGLKHIGENKVQDAKVKFTDLGEAAGQVTKHMIGHLQTNKVKLALELFDVIQSVDSLKLVKEIETQAAKLNGNVDIFLEVNVSGEEQKFGFLPSDVMPAVEILEGLPHTHLKGLMTMAPLTEDATVIRQCFRDLRNLRDQMGGQLLLSMGMTHDFEIALEEGSNMLRIGRAIFKSE